MERTRKPKPSRGYTLSFERETNWGVGTNCQTIEDQLSDNPSISLRIDGMSVVEAQFAFATGFVESFDGAVDLLPLDVERRLESESLWPVPTRIEMTSCQFEEFA